MHQKNEHAYIIGGYTGKMKVMRQCLYFNAINQKLENFANLTVARCRAGTVVTKSFIYVFGGVGLNFSDVDQIERCALKDQKFFEKI